MRLKSNSYFRGDFGLDGRYGIKGIYGDRGMKGERGPAAEWAEPGDEGEFCFYQMNILASCVNNAERSFKQQSI